MKPRLIRRMLIATHDSYDDEEDALGDSQLADEFDTKEGCALLFRNKPAIKIYVLLSIIVISARTSSTAKSPPVTATLAHPRHTFWRSISCVSRILSSNTMSAITTPRHLDFITNEMATAICHAGSSISKITLGKLP